ncbi:hypothetical protein C8F01DRAFT_362154 [Mycena amicta]|nr:hypothetical protein C8F01DRAFT_362154 [Mycena amicta]
MVQQFRRLDKRLGVDDLALGRRLLCKDSTARSSSGLLVENKSSKLDITIRLAPPQPLVLVRELSTFSLSRGVTHLLFPLDCHLSPSSESNGCKPSNAYTWCESPSSSSSMLLDVAPEPRRQTAQMRLTGLRRLRQCDFEVTTGSPQPRLYLLGVVRRYNIAEGSPS